MAPGMRVAWLVVQDRELLEKLTPLKQATDLHTSTFMQRDARTRTRAGRAW